MYYVCNIAYYVGIHMALGVHSTFQALLFISYSQQSFLALVLDSSSECDWNDRMSNRLCRIP